MVLYRPWLPALRAQSLQVLQSAHALAARGHTVRICYRPTGGCPLRPFGLQPLPTLELKALSRSGSVASAQMRVEMLRWEGTFLAREKRLAHDLIRWRPHADLVVEAHEVDSMLMEERGEPSALMFRLEQVVLKGARAVIANCEGVAEALQNTHDRGATVVHNAGVIREPAVGVGVVYAGSAGPGKDLETVARAARERPIDVVGPLSPGRWKELRHLSAGGLRWRGEVQPGQLPEVLQRYSTSIVPLGPGLFGEQFTSPLKAWSAMGVGVPFAGADTPALRRVAPGAFEPYRSGDPASLLGALEQLDRPEIHARRRAAARPWSWAERAAVVEEVLAG